MNKEVFVLFALVLTGAALGVVYHIQKAIKNTIRLHYWGYIILDFLYLIFCGIFVYLVILITNDAKIRAYEFLGLFLGYILYFFSVGKWFFAFFEWTFKNILKIFHFILKILLTPVRFLDKILVCMLNKIFGGAKDNAEKEKTS